MSPPPISGMKLAPCSYMQPTLNIKVIASALDPHDEGTPFHHDRHCYNPSKRDVAFGDRNRTLDSDQASDCGFAAVGASYDLVSVTFRFLGKLQSLGFVSAVDWPKYRELLA